MLQHVNGCVVHVFWDTRRTKFIRKKNMMVFVLRLMIIKCPSSKYTTSFCNFTSNIHQEKIGQHMLNHVVCVNKALIPTVNIVDISTVCLIIFLSTTSKRKVTIISIFEFIKSLYFSINFTVVMSTST